MYRNLQIILLIIYFSTTMLHSQPITVGEFQALEKSVSKDLSATIQNSIVISFHKKNEKDIQINNLNTRDGIQDAKSKNRNLFINGYFFKKENDSNLYLYAQVYDVQTGYLIDAYNFTDYMDELGENILLDKKEIIESDIVRINKFSEKLVSKIKLNPTRKENKNEIESALQDPRLSGLGDFNRSPQKVATGETADDVFDLLQSQITVSATKVKKQANEAPNLVSIISQKEMREYGRLSLNEILYQLPGFSPSQDYDRRTVSSRGMYEGWNNNHTLMLMDGVQFNDSLYGAAFTWEVMPLFMIKSLEVIRGPGSALYGSNATNGVVSLNTYSGEDLKGEVRTKVRVGDYGTKIYDFLSGNKSKYASYAIGFNQHETNGNNYSSYDGSYRADEFGFLKKFSTKDARSNTYIFLRVDGEDFLKGLSVQFHRQKWNYKTGHGWLWRIPDLNENLQEMMDTLSIKYSSKITENLTQEYVLRHQSRSVDWNLRFAEKDGYEGYYPAGVNEFLKSGAKEILGRAQFTYLLPNGGSALLGVETTGFRYTGDLSHFSNINLKDSANGFPAYENDVLVQQGPWLEWIQGKTIPKGAIFAQFVSGKFLYEKLEITAGVRYDERNIKYKQIDNPYQDITGFPYYPDAKRVFRKTSPRIGLVVFLMKNLTLKFMGGNAFREPSITEMFGANTFTLAANPRQLKPEIINTREIALDWFITKSWNLRMNVFETRFENLIAYSVANNNLSTNVYTLQTRGFEAELVYEVQKLAFFGNLSYNQRTDEDILDNTISSHKKSVTWAPTNTQNLGVRGEYGKFGGSLSLQRLGPVNRRNSDFGTPDQLTGYVYVDPYQYPQYRNRTIPQWYNVNVRLVYHITEKWNAGISITNALRNHQLLVKNNLYPFDYQREGRRVIFEMNANF